MTAAEIARGLGHCDDSGEIGKTWFVLLHGLCYTEHGKEVAPWLVHSPEAATRTSSVPVKL